MNQRQNSREVLHRLNRVLIIAGILSLVAGFVLRGFFTIFVIGLVICAAVSLYRSIRFGARVLGLFAASIIVSLAIAFSLALAGFYGPNTKVAGEFDTGLTWVSNKDLEHALYASVFWPDVYTASLLGFSCNGSYGQNCSATPLVLAVGADGVLLIGGVAVGTKLAGRRLKA
jgi:energy-coupling factor transporter transmembrane protein EcfT